MLGSVSNLLQQATGLPRLAIPRATPINNRRGARLTFTASTSWTSPVAFIRVAYGRGQDGEPATGEHSYADAYVTYSQTIYQDASGNFTEGPETSQGTSIGAMPSAHCDTVAYPTGGGYATCYRYEYTTVDVGDYEPATNGAALTAFGLSFPGGAGRAASIKTVQAVRVVPNQMYAIVVPPGGSLTIIY